GSRHRGRLPHPRRGRGAPVRLAPARRRGAWTCLAGTRFPYARRHRMTDKVLVTTNDAVTVLTLNRPEIHNAVDGETAEAIGTAIDAFAVDDEARVLVVTGAGPLSFCSGADLEHGGTLLEHPYTDKAGPMGFAAMDP